MRISPISISSPPMPISSALPSCSGQRKSARWPANSESASRTGRCRADVKIETPLAVRNLPRLIVQAGGIMPVAVMIARGAISRWRSASIGSRKSRRKSLALRGGPRSCRLGHASARLSRERGPGNARRDDGRGNGSRAECVMLNKGQHLAKAVAFLDDVLRRMDRHQSKKRPRLAPLQSWQGPQGL